MIDPFASSTQIPNYGVTNTAYDQRSITCNEDWIIRPTLLNQFRFSYSLNSNNQASTVRTSWADFGSKVTLGALPPRAPQIFVNRFWKRGTFGNDNVAQNSFGPSDTLMWIANGHSIRAGGGMTRHTFVETSNWLGAGQIRFSGSRPLRPGQPAPSARCESVLAAEPAAQQVKEFPAVRSRPLNLCRVSAA